MTKTVFVIGLVLSFAALGYGQVFTITNSSFEKYTKQRLAAEREYRENYAKMGFPSPEELEVQRQEDMAARIELSQSLRQARLEEERIGVERETLALQTARFEAEQAEREEVEASYQGNSSGYYGGGYAGGYGGYGGYGAYNPYGYGRFYRGRIFKRSYGNRNRLIPMIDLGGYRATPYGTFPTQSPRQVYRGRYR